MCAAPYYNPARLQRLLELRTDTLTEALEGADEPGRPLCLPTLRHDLESRKLECIKEFITGCAPVVADVARLREEVAALGTALSGAAASLATAAGARAGFSGGRRPRRRPGRVPRGRHPVPRRL